MKKLNTTNKVSLILVILLISSFNSISQISQKGVPWSFNYNISDISEHSIPEPDIEKIMAEDDEAEKNGSFYKFGRLIPTDININNKNNWITLGNNDKIWILKLSCKKAKALSLYFENFYIPPGGKLFIYTADKKQILGAYTEFNNSSSGIFATELVYSDELIIEYNEYAKPYGEVNFSISDIGYAYRGVYPKPHNNLKAFGDSESCEVNVNCSPEGDSWQNQKRGAVKVSLVAGGSMGSCSGSLINNTSNDCTPYILTADHCGGDATTAEYQQWIFYFNYESPECSNPPSEGSLASETMNGCAIVAQGGQGGTAGSDFQLLECNNSIPESYNPYYNGWNRENVGATSGVSIHHPAGDIKKISTFTTPLTNDDWNGSGYDSHWNVVWSATTNGHGVTEGGSSGSPIFDSNGLIVGDLTGGSSYCSSPTAPDMYGKLSYSWESNGTTPAEQLKPWLDPINTGAMTHPGMNFCGSSGLYADFSFLPLIGVTGVPVDFTDLSLGNITSWSWEFQNAVPNTSTAQNPTGITYNIAGVYNITLTVSGGSGSDTRIKEINIIPPSPPTADFIASATQIYQGDTVDFIDLTTGGPTNWEWTFIGGDPFSSAVQNPSEIIYNTPGIYTVSLNVSNAYGGDFHTKTNYIEVLEGTPVILYCDTLSNMNSFDSLMAIQMSPWGLLPGHNPLYISNYADLYITPYYDYISGFLVPVHTSNSTINSAKVKFKVWDYDVTPGNILGYKEMYLSEMHPNTYQLIMFDSDIMINGSFFVGYGITYYMSDDYSGPDNFAVHMAEDRGSSGSSTLYVNYNNNWHNASQLGLLNNIHSSLGIEPIACSLNEIEQIETNDNIVTVYPNPSKDEIHILLENNNESEFEIMVFNSLGQYMDIPEKENILNHHIINFRNLQQGIYFINIIIEGSVIVRKVSIIK